MNILFVTDNFPPMDGGIAAFNYNICRELCDRGNRVAVIANRFPGAEAFDGDQPFKTHRLSGRMRPTSVEAIHAVLKAVRHDNIDIIFFGHFGSTHWLSGVLARKLFKIPYVILVHGTEFNAYHHRFTRADRWASRIVLRNATRIIANSKATQRLVADHGYPEHKIAIVHPGTDPAAFADASAGAHLKKTLGLEGMKVMLSISRLVAKKNHLNVLRALPEVIKKIPRLCYLVVGKGPEEDSIRACIAELALGEHVRMLGYVEPTCVAPYYHAADVFVMPSKTVDIDYESFGIVYLEANACGKPVIAGRSGGIEDAVMDGVTGVLVNPDSVEEIASSLIRLLNDVELSYTLGTNGRQRVVQEFNWVTVGRKIDSIMNDVIAHVH